MGIETRNGKGAYFYRKRREGGRVVSEYAGSSRMAFLAETTASIVRDEETLKRMEWRSQREEAEAADRELDELAESLDDLVSATLLLQGYHQHKGEWRRRRVKQSQE